MRAWVTERSVRLIAEESYEDMEVALLHSLRGRTFKAMDYTCKSEGYQKGRAEIYLMEVKDVSPD